MLDLPTAYHTSKLASQNAKGNDRLQFQLVSGVLMAVMGGKMALEALRKMDAAHRPAGRNR